MLPAPTWPVLVQPSTALDGYPTRRPWLKAELKSKSWGLSGRISARRPVAHSTFGARSYPEGLGAQALAAQPRAQTAAKVAPLTGTGLPDPSGSQGAPHALRRERKLAQTPAGQGVDGIADRRGHQRQAVLAGAGRL